MQSQNTLLTKFASVGSGYRKNMLTFGVGLLTMLAGCEDEPFVKGGDAVSEYPVFDVQVISSWKPGTSVARNGDTDISIDALDCESDGKPLYLVTETSVLNDSAASFSSSRGTKVETAADFEKHHKSFGLSAICYDGADGSTDADLSKFTTNYAHNLETTKNGTVWSVNSEKLNWSGSGRIRFYAYAPYSGSDTDGRIKHSTTSHKGEPQITLTVNPDVKSQIDFMTATADCSGKGNSGVNLRFGHALSAISIKTGEGFLAGNITKVTISGVHGTGTLTLGDSNDWTTPDESPDESFSIDTNLSIEDTDGDNSAYAGAGTNIAGNNDGLTFFMIPQALTESATLTISFKDNLTQVSRTLTATIGGSGKKWEAGKMYSYSLSSTGIVITPVVKITKRDGSALPDSIAYTGVIRDLKMNAYLKVDQAKVPTSYIRPEYKVLSATDNGSGSWQQADWDKADWKEVPGIVGDDDNAVVFADDVTEDAECSLVLLPQDEFDKMRSQMNFAKADKVGSSTSPHDLSEGGETANCYMIRKWGYYKIPIVYGNGRKSTGIANTSAYNMTTTVSTDTETGTVPTDTETVTRKNGLAYFVDHNNNKITTYDIKTQLASYGLSIKDAFLLWQDSPGLIDDVKLDGNFIRFRVSRHSLSQGNAVIALRDNKGDIAWSWHIWATHYDWSDRSIETTTNTDAAEKYTFAPSTLGYCDDHGAATPRRIRMKLVFDLKDFNDNDFVTYTYTDNNGNDRPIEFVQKGITASLAGDNTYYQWGRKDPMVPGIYDKSDYKYYYYKPKSDGTIMDDAGEFTMLNKEIFDYRKEYKFTCTPNVDGLNIGDAIKHPHWFILGEGNNAYRQHWHNETGMTYLDAEGALMFNVWNSSATSVGDNYSNSSLNGQPTTKTIYDPCPAGFCVPPANAFTAFADYSKKFGETRCYPTNPITFDSSKRRWHLKSQKNGGGADIYLYATGLRDFNMNDANLPYKPNALINHTWASFSMLTFISSTTLFQGTGKPQCLIFYIDNRYDDSGVTKFDGYNHADKFRCGSCCGSNNSYGLTVWPVHDN